MTNFRLLPARYWSIICRHPSRIRGETLQMWRHSHTVRFLYNSLVWQAPSLFRIYWTFRIPCSNLLPPCSKLKERIQDKAEIITNYTRNSDPLQRILMGRHDPPKRPHKCEPKRCHNREDSNPNLSGLVNTGKYRKKLKQESRRQLHCKILCPVFINYRQEEHFYFFWYNPQWARASSFTRFLDHTRRKTTVGRTPLDVWLARRRDLYLTTHNNHNRQISMPPMEYEPTISAGEQPQTYTLERVAVNSGQEEHNNAIIQTNQIAIY